MCTCVWPHITLYFVVLLCRSFTLTQVLFQLSCIFISLLYNIWRVKLSLYWKSMFIFVVLILSWVMDVSNKLIISFLKCCEGACLCLYSYPFIVYLPRKTKDFSGMSIIPSPNWHFWKNSCRPGYRFTTVLTQNLKLRNYFLP